MRSPLVSFRLPADVEAALTKAAPTNTSAVVVEALRRHLIPDQDEEADDAPAPATAPPAAAAAPVDHGPALDAAALAAVASLPLTIPAADAARRLRQHLAMSDAGAAFDLGDGQEPIPLDADVVTELLADVVQARGSGGSGGKATGEFKPPPKVEPPPFGGLLTVTGDGVHSLARVDINAYVKMTRDEQRRFQETHR